MKTLFIIVVLLYPFEVLYAEVFQFTEKNGNTFVWSNYEEENGNYCIWKSQGKFCVAKSDIKDIKPIKSRADADSTKVIDTKTSSYIPIYEERKPEKDSSPKTTKITVKSKIWRDSSGTHSTMTTTRE